MGGFWSELKRRNVMRVAGFHILAAWITLQVVETVGGLIELPAWIGQIAVILAVITFPAAVYVGWAYTFTEGSIRRIDRNQQAIPANFLDYSLFSALALLIALGTYQLFHLDAGLSGSTGSETARKVAAAPHTDNSIAVLPFLNMSSDPEQEYFSDGITEEILNVLAKMPGLQVTSRTSSFALKGKQLSVPEIADSLGVAYILEGSIRKSGNRVRITAQLIQVGNDFHLFSETWDRSLDDVFAVQDEISAKIGKILKVKLIKGDVDQIERQLLSPELLDDYLQATQLMAATNYTNARRAEQLLQGVIEDAPKFSQARSRLANVYLTMIQIGNMHPGEAIDKATPLAKEALALEPGNAEALNTLSYIYRAQGRLEESERLLQQALLLEPGNAAALRQSIGNAAYGRELQRSDDLVERLLRVDPLSETTLSVAQDYYRRAGMMEKAEAIMARLKDIEGAELMYSTLMDVNNYHRGGPRETLRYTRRSYELEPRFAESVARLVLAHLDLGQLDAATELLDNAPAFKAEEFHSNRARMLYAIHQGNSTAALASAQALLDPETPDRYGSRALALRVSLLQSSAEVEAYQVLIKRYLKNFPELAQNLVPNPGQLPPMLNKSGHFMVANDLAYLYRATGEEDKAVILDEAIAATLGKWPRTSVLGSGLADVEYHARRGRRAEALAALGKTLERDWHHLWWFHLDHSPHLTALREDPDFQALRQRYFGEF